jgi:3-deoxy-D-manno-octulosonic-acid transferase
MLGNKMSKIYLIIYNALFILCLPVIVIVFLFSNKHRKEFFYKLSERFACYKYSNNTLKTKTIWIHCASLGEVRAAEPILDDLKNKYYIVLTTLTKSGREYAQKIQKADFIALLPLDIYPIMNKVFNIVKPDMLVLVETELWANMLYVASNKNIKIITVNGRMSAKSFKVYKKITFFWKRFISLINIVIARSKDDAYRFKFLTDGKSDIIVSGNIKYDQDFTLNVKREDFFLNEDDFVFTAGSTREGEEEIVADAYDKIKSDFKNIKFFLAPRHLSRLEEVIKILENRNIKYSLFSDGKFSKGFILVDVFGKLQGIYSVSDVCYVGGSIVNKGGQNPIEPAAYGKPVLFGKNMDNFTTETESLIKEGGALVVKDANDLADKIKKFILNRKFLENVGEGALKTVKSQKGAVAFTIEKIKENLNA